MDIADDIPDVMIRLKRVFLYAAMGIAPDDRSPKRLHPFVRVIMPPISFSVRTTVRPNIDLILRFS